MVLKLGSRGKAVTSWQGFLSDLGMLAEPPDGVFGQNTHRATLQFQTTNAVGATGELCANTLRAAEAAGFLGIGFYPPKPDFQPITTTAGRHALFGRLRFVRAPRAADRDAIRITNGWSDNLELVDVPQLAGVPFGWGGTCEGTVRFHKSGAAPLKGMFRDWEAAGLRRRILTFDGAYNPRLMRGSRTVLSAHAFGSAIDLNAQWNGLGRVPASLGARGCVLELVRIASSHGFYWGGHFSSRKDGMHFELARLPS